MIKEDRKLAADLKEMKSDLIDAAVRFREEAPGLSYILWDYSGKVERALQRLTPVKRDMEGGGLSWFYVCEECHGQVDSRDGFCRHCGRPLEDEHD